MSLVTVPQVNPNSEVTSASVNAGPNAIAEVVNGQLDDTNIASLSGSKLAAGTVPASASTVDSNPETRTSEGLGDFVASGLLWSATTGLDAAMTAGVAYVGGKRLSIALIASKAFTANKDTYVGINNTGTVAYSEVANGAVVPSLPANSIWLAKIVTNGSAVTSVVDLRSKKVTERMWWEEIGRATLSTASDAITVNIPAKSHLKLLVNIVSTGGTTSVNLRFNSDSGTNYADRISVDGGADATGGSGTSSVISGAGTFTTLAYEGDIHNNLTAREKIMMGFRVDPGSAGGAGVPNKAEFISKWANTTAQITRVDVLNLAGTGDFAIGSEVIVLGHD